jgi:hypothetical protein
VPHFVPPQDQKPSHSVAMGRGTKSPLPGWKINAIANHRIWWEIRAPQLLTEDLLAVF